MELEMQHNNRKGTMLTATAHIVTAVIGSGVLALPWSVAQLGWVAGPFSLLCFSFITYYTSTMLANSYMSADGYRNSTYMAAVRSYLGPIEVLMCGVAQYASLWGTLVGYTITATTSMVAIRQSDCFHRNADHNAKCGTWSNALMVAFGIIQLLLSQLPSLEKVTWLSILATVMSFAYSLIGLGLCVAKWVSHGDSRGGLTGNSEASSAAKAWDTLQALGNIAFAYTFAEVLIEIQDTLKSPPPESKTMKKAAFLGIAMATAFYLLLGCIGYVALGSGAPGNILTGNSFFEPFWLIDIGNFCVVVHLVGAYQVFAQPIFAAVEKQITSRWPEAAFINKEYKFRFFNKGLVNLSLLKLVVRSLCIILTTLVSMLLPFFNAVLGLLGALSFWPLTVHFPVRMHIAREKIRSGSLQWIMLQGLSIICLFVSVAATVGSVADIVHNLKLSSPFSL